MKKLMSNALAGVFMIAVFYVLLGTTKMIVLIPEYMMVIVLGHGAAIPMWQHILVIGYVVSVLVLVGIFGYCIWGVKVFLRRNERRDALYEEKLQDMQEEADLSELKTRDPGFSEDKFIIRAKKMIVAMLEAQSKKEVDKLRILLGDQLFEEWLTGIEKMKMQQLQQVYERLFITEAKLTRYWKEGSRECLEAIFLINYRGCVKHVDTGDIVSGNMSHKIVKKVKVIFIRTQGVQTDKDSDLFHIEYCPNCGAPLEISVKGVCQYCQTVVSSGTFQWAIETMGGEIIEEMGYTLKEMTS